MPDKYGHAHRQKRKSWIPIVAAGQGYCAEPACLMDTRWIPAAWANTQLWHLCHDPTGTVVIGIGHRKCNVTEGATRMHVMRKQARVPRRWTL